mmetsp:Transcript_12211/g.28758  ORF Transcript_12211/g.28758 Transcript_12211/m.28758 type:complete len:118 (+) Transcript_12211:1246-1599(+)
MEESARKISSSYSALTICSSGAVNDELKTSMTLRHCSKTVIRSSKSLVLEFRFSASRLSGEADLSLIATSENEQPSEDAMEELWHLAVMDDLQTAMLKFPFLVDVLQQQREAALLTQ